MSKLPNAAKAGLLGAAIVIALVAGWLLLIGPKRSEKTKLEQQIAETQAQIDTAYAGRSPSRAPAIRVADLFKLSRAMPNTADITGVLLQLSNVAGETGVTFQSITPHDPVSLGAYQQIGIDLTFEGRFYDLSDFLYRLRNLVDVRHGTLDATGRLFAIDEVDFAEAPPPPGFPQIRAHLVIDAFVYGTGTAPTVAPPTGTTGASGATGATGATPATPPATPTDGSASAAPAGT